MFKLLENGLASILNGLDFLVDRRLPAYERGMRAALEWIGTHEFDPDEDLPFEGRCQAAGVFFMPPMRTKFSEGWNAVISSWKEHPHEQTEKPTDR